MLSAFCDGRVFGERIGSSPPQVLALHGWRNDHNDLAAVTVGLNAIALDLPGFGASPVPADVWGAADYAHAIVSVLDEFETPPVIFGHSFGGRVALELAAHYSERVHAIVLTGTPLIRRVGTVKKPPLSFRLAKLANRVGILSDGRMEDERRKRGSDDYRAASGIMRDVFVKLVNESYENELRSVDCLTELVWGENDTAAQLWQAQEAMDLLKNGKLTVVSGGSHFITKSDPQVLRDAIERGLA